MMKRLSLTVLLVLPALASGGSVVTPGASAQATGLAPLADAYVDAARPTRNFGTVKYVRTDAEPLNISYLRFDASAVADRGSARLRIFALSSNQAGIVVRSVDDTSWSERGITFDNRPPRGAVIADTGGTTANTWYSLDVSAAMQPDGRLSVALESPSTTSLKVASRETATQPLLQVPAPPIASEFVILRDGSTYIAQSSTTPDAVSGTLKQAVEGAVRELQVNNGGRVRFLEGIYDYGSEHAELYDTENIDFQGAGIDATVIRNNSSASTDTEPFDMSRSSRVGIRDMTIEAAGPFRNTSDAIDFDGAADVVVERVKVTAARGRGIVFDGKDLDSVGPRSANGNVIRDCVVTGVPSDGIELLAAQSNVVERCVVTDVGGHGIQLTKSSSSAGQPNKKPNWNTVSGNTVDEAGQDGINLNAGDGNTFAGNHITNSSDVVASRDGIRLGTADGIGCDDNIVQGNTSGDNQATPTQRYGLNISSSLCHRTRVLENVFSGNRLGGLLDNGTGTVYE